MLISVASSPLTPDVLYVPVTLGTRSSSHIMLFLASKCLSVLYLPPEIIVPLLNLGISKHSSKTQFRHSLFQEAFPDTYPGTPGASLSLCQLPALR